MECYQKKPSLSQFKVVSAQQFELMPFNFLGSSPGIVYDRWSSSQKERRQSKAWLSFFPLLFLLYVAAKHTRPVARTESLATCCRIISIGSRRSTRSSKLLYVILLQYVYLQDEQKRFVYDRKRLFSNLWVLERKSSSSSSCFYYNFFFFSVSRDRPACSSVRQPAVSRRFPHKNNNNNNKNSNNRPLGMDVAANSMGRKAGRQAGTCWRRRKEKRKRKKKRRGKSPGANQSKTCV